MSIYGSITVECDRKTCHGSLTIDADDITVKPTRHGLTLELSAAGWVTDDDGDVRCPQCVEEAQERDEAYERAAARDRLDDFARTGGKDWT